VTDLVKKRKNEQERDSLGLGLFGKGKDREESFVINCLEQPSYICFIFDIDGESRPLEDTPSAAELQFFGNLRTIGQVKVEDPDQIKHHEVNSQMP
jgi:hypothetical protein